MKKLSILLFCAGVCALNSPATAQSSKKFKFHKVAKDVRKDAHRLEKEGWKVTAGSTPLKNQLESAYSKQDELDEEGFPKYIFADGSSVANSQAAAEMQAVELAKNRLVGLIETQMKDVITSDVANNQIDSKDAATITKTIETSTNTVSKKLSRVLPVFKIYRNVSNNTEVQIKIAYNYALVRKQMLEEMRTILKFETEEQRKKFDKFLSAEEYKKGEIKNTTEG